MNTAGRRQAQARNNYRHIAPLMRPHYPHISLEKSRNKLMRLIEKQKLMQMRKGKKK